MPDTSRLLSVSVETELTKSYLDYAMSVIVGRALPDCRDGLKPVHRRILYAMHELGNTFNKPYKKSARIVGDVQGKYHPHGEAAIYDSIVRMAQPFSMRYTLIDGQGNFGSVDGDMAAAMRYTEIRMTPLTQELLLNDLDKDTVDFSPNYDGTESIPNVLPAAFPNFLVNGSAGIAVGMATQTPPHHLGEVLDAFLHYVDHPECTVAELMEKLPGPDFPTKGQILGTNGIYQAYQTGKGRVVLRGTHHLEHPTDDRTSIVITEIPYQVNKAKFVEKIAELAREKKIEGISALRDESDKDGMRIVIELKRDGNASLILNQLYQNTPLQTSFSINMVGLANGHPQLLTLKKIFEYFLQHRLDIVTRRTRHAFQKARQKVHLLEGLTVALVHIDEIIALIQASATAKEAKEKLCEKTWSVPMLAQWSTDELRDSLLLPQFLPYGLNRNDEYQLSHKQAENILEMRLHKLTALEKDELQTDYLKILKEVEELQSILSSAEKRLEIVKAECLQIRLNYQEPRQSKIDYTESDLIENEDLIPREQLMITLSQGGYIKTQPLSDFEEQRRGGKGRTAGKFKGEDCLNKILVAHSHDTLLCFSSAGKVYALRVFELPSGSRYSSGRPIVNCISLGEGESISAFLSISGWDGYVFMTTRYGVVKKVDLNLFKNTRSSGIIAIGLDEGDSLDHVFLTSGQDEIMLFNSQGKAIRFSEEEVRPTGRTSRGIRGMTLKDKSSIVSAVRVDLSQQEQLLVLTASQNGYGKCTPLDQYRTQSRGGMGVRAMNDSPRNGPLIGAIIVSAGDHLLFLTANGRSLRTSLENIALRSRNTQGVRLVRTNEQDHLCRLERIDKQFIAIQEDQLEEAGPIEVIEDDEPEISEESDS